MHIWRPIVSRRRRLSQWRVCRLQSAHLKCDCVTVSRRKLAQFRMCTPTTTFQGQLHHHGATKAAVIRLQMHPPLPRKMKCTSGHFAPYHIPESPMQMTMEFIFKEHGGWEFCGEFTWKCKHCVFIYSNKLPSESVKSQGFLTQSPQTIRQPVYKAIVFPFLFFVVMSCKICLQMF